MTSRGSYMSNYQWMELGMQHDYYQMHFEDVPRTLRLYHIQYERHELY